MTSSVKPIATERIIDYSMRAKQLATTVRRGQMITLIILDENPIDVYLAGWDADTYFVVYPYGEQIMTELIPKQNILKIVLHPESTFREEPLYEDMNQIVRSFRDMINKTYFNAPADSAAHRTSTS